MSIPLLFKNKFFDLIGLYEPELLDVPKRAFSLQTEAVESPRKDCENYGIITYLTAFSQHVPL
jgi:hypothetical protein